MSLVLEALRRVEKPGTPTVGAAVSSYRPAPKRPGGAFPLLLGLGAGGLVIALFAPQAKDLSVYPGRDSSESRYEGRVAHRPKGRAGLPPPLVPPIGFALEALPGRRAVAAADRVRPVVSPSVAPTPPLLVLQAISERDSRPIAIINDQLVKEGDRVGAALVVKISVETVEVILENGVRETIRFPPTPPEAIPTPTPPPSTD